MKEIFYGFKDSNGNRTTQKILPAGSSYIDSEHINNGDIFNSDGNAFIGAKVAEADFTISVQCALYFGAGVGYSPWHDLLDESGTRVKTFDSTKIFQASLYNQDWWNKNHQGFKTRYTRDSGSGDCTIDHEGTVS